MKTFVACFMIVCMLGTPGIAQARTIEFSEHVWEVKTSDKNKDGVYEEEERRGPGPNYFSDSPENVWIDGQGLHLKITYRNEKWYCAEIFSQESLGYGTYRFYVGSRIDQLNENVVAGLFTYETDTREIDIEFAKWGELANDNSQFVVQPYDPDVTPGNIHRFNIELNGTHSTHSFDWKLDRIFFQSAHGHYEVPPATHIIDSWRYDGPDVPPAGNERVHLNLWLFQGEPPTDGQEIEVVITKFEFIPAPQLEAVKTVEAVDRIDETLITDVFAEDTITYIIDVTNFFEQTISLMIHDALNAYTAYVENTFKVNGAETAVDFSSGVLDYEYTGLEQNKTLTLSFDVSVDEDALHSAMIENVAYVTAFDLSGASLGAAKTNLTQVRVENPDSVLIPEPSPIIFLSLGLIGLFTLIRGKQRQRK